MQGGDWYSYITLEFKLPRNSYRVQQKAPFTCPTCTRVDLVRINNVKAKIKRLGNYECSTCLNKKALEKARAAHYEKYGGNYFKKNKVVGPNRD